MADKSFFKLFYTDHKMVIIHNGEEWLGIETEKFYNVTLEYFKVTRPTTLDKHDQVITVMAYGGGYVIHENAENTAEHILNGINNGLLNFNRYTPYDFDEKDVSLALEGIFECIHNNSLASFSHGRIDVDAKPIYGSNDLMISIKMLELQGSLGRLFSKQPKIKKEYIVESNNIKRVYGNSVELNIELKSSPHILKITV